MKHASGSVKVIVRAQIILVSILAHVLLER